MQLSAVLLIAAATLASAETITTTQPSPEEIEKARATAVPLSPTSHVKGLAFDRFIQIWLENTDFDDAANDPSLKKLAEQGITLTNFWAITHPSEPNYVAAVVGDEFGMDNDDFWQLPSNISTVADLLDTRGISWGEYQEHLPHAGFQGFYYKNQETGADDYVRKHNPLVIENSVTDSNIRPRQIKNFTSFEKDLREHKLPQWSFVTPNMTNDGHDTDITFSGKWSLDWLTPLLQNKYLTRDTLILLTFDESGTYSIPNRVFSLLLGGAVPRRLRGTKDDTFYTHYSAISTVSANWRLPSLGRWDCGANIFKLVADKTGYVNYEVDTTNLYLNHTYPGPLSDDPTPNWNVPLTGHERCSAGQGILHKVKRTWGHLKPTYDYTTPFPIDEKHNINTGVKFWKPKRHHGH